MTISEQFPEIYRPWWPLLKALFLEISRKVHNRSEGKTDPNSGKSEISVKADKRHAIKAILVFSKSKPVLEKLELWSIPGTLCEA